MWFLLALLSAFFNSLGNVARRTHGSLAQPAELAWWSLLFSLPLGVGLVLVSNEPLFSSYDFLFPVILGSAISCFASVTLFKAYKYGDASAVSPLTNILPVVLVFTSFVILGSLPGLYGLGGILLIVAGIYYSSVSGKHKLTHPLKLLMKNRGSRAMMLWVALVSIVVVLVTIGLRSASPSFLLLAMQLTEFFLLSVYLLCRPMRHRVKHGEDVLRKWGWHIAAISVFSTASVFFQFQAMNLADQNYVMAVKRMDVLFTVLLAGLFLHEKHILRRFRGSALAVIGVVIIVLFG